MRILHYSQELQTLYISGGAHTYIYIYIRSIYSVVVCSTATAAQLIYSFTSFLYFCLFSRGPPPSAAFKVQYVGIATKSVADRVSACTFNWQECLAVMNAPTWEEDTSLCTGKRRAAAAPAGASAQKKRKEEKSRGAERSYTKKNEKKRQTRWEKRVDEGGEERRRIKRTPHGREEDIRREGVRERERGVWKMKTARCCCCWPLFCPRLFVCFLPFPRQRAVHNEPGHNGAQRCLSYGLYLDLRTLYSILSLICCTAASVYIIYLSPSAIYLTSRFLETMRFIFYNQLN